MCVCVCMVSLELVDWNLAGYSRMNNEQRTNKFLSVVVGLSVCLFGKVDFDFDFDFDLGLCFASARSWWDT